MKPGEYAVKLVDAGMKDSHKGEPVPFLKFENEEGEHITWEGYLGSEKAKDFSIKNLFTAGFIGRDWDDMALGMTKFALIPLRITVIEETAKNGKKYTKVQWINGGKVMKKISQSEIKAKMSDKDIFSKYAPKQKEDAGF
jgi:hypothetical protein